MSPMRSYLLVLSLGVLAACNEDKPNVSAPPESSGAALAAGKNRLNLRQPSTQMPRVDPQVLKEYRADVCYFGTLTLRQARAAYLGSLGSSEPSEKKLPTFGGAPAAVAVVGADAGAHPAAPASAAPAGDAGAPRPDATLRAPHERNAAACSVAMKANDPAMPAVDKALADYAPFVAELAKNVSIASSYYQREEWKKDGFEKGKELHKALVAEFAKLDDLSNALGDAIAAWHKDHLPDASKLEDGQKPAFAATEAARALITTLLAKKVDATAAKAALDKIPSVESDLKAYGDANPTDPFGKMLGPSLPPFERAARTVVEKHPDKAVDPNDLLAATTTFTGVVEANQRALARYLVSKGKTTSTMMPSRLNGPTPPSTAPDPAASGAPAPPPPQ